MSHTQQPPPNYPPQPLRPESPFPPVPQKKPWFKRWWAIVLFILAGLILLGALLSPDTVAPTTAVPAPTVTVTETEQAEPAPTVTETTAPKAEPKDEPKPKAEPELGEGTYEVGKDVKAGRYKTTVPDDSFGCYWERTKDDSGDFDSIITNDNADPGAKVSVTIKRGEFFKNNGCGDWVKQ